MAAVKNLGFSSLRLGPVGRVGTASRLLDLGTLLVLVLLLRTVLDTTFQSRPFRSAVDEVRAWRQALRDPRAGSLVSLRALTPVAGSAPVPRSYKPRAVLLCMSSTCGT